MLSSENKKKLEVKINSADALLIITGAGMGIDSGLPDYRGPQGLWNTWHPAKQLNMTYENLSTHEMFLENPELAWGFQTYLTKLYQELSPHKGYYDLLEISNKKFNGNYFVITSNVDSQFLKSGFDENKLYEVHGTKRLWQCTDKKCNKRFSPWNMSIDKLPTIDENSLYTIKPLPKCINCGAMARPNVSFFNDLFFNENITKKHSLRLEDWLNKNKNKKLIILEIGCGISIHSLRLKLKDGQYKMMSNEWKLPREFLSFDKTSLVRINPDVTQDTQEDLNGIIPLGVGGKKGISIIKNLTKFK